MLAFDEIGLGKISDRVLAGEELPRHEAAAIVNCPDERLSGLLLATRKVREAYFGKRVKICMLRNAQSGICPEDCGYCSQSRISKADIPVYKLQSVEQLVEGARIAVENNARRYCMVASMRGPSAADVEHFGRACESIRNEFPKLEICLSVGLLSEQQARVLKARGAGWINHNLNTSRRFYPMICTTHTWDDRVRTIENVRAAGLLTCSGGIVGMGETDDDILDLAYATRALALPTPVTCQWPLSMTSFISPRSRHHRLTSPGAAIHKRSESRSPTR